MTTLLFLALALGACGRGPVTSAGAAGTGGDDDAPWNRTFLSTAVTENGEPRPLVGGTRISLTFVEDGHRIGAQAGCNSMGGQASFEGGRLVVGDLATTEMGCDPPRHAQDEWLAGFLTSRPQYSFSGDTPEPPGNSGSTLTLDNGTTRIVLDDREVADPDRPLRGTKWVVDTIVEGESASSVPAGAEAYLVFGDDNHFSGNAGCNRMGGDSVIHEDTSTITFSGVITTKMACQEDRMRLERAVLATLDGDVAYQIDAAVLRLDGPDGHGLRLRATAAE